MKLKYLKQGITQLVVLVIAFGCTQDNTSFDEIHKRPGAYLRTLETNTGTFSRHGLDEIIFEVDFEVFDDEQGQLLEFVDVFVSYDDERVSGHTIQEKISTLHKSGFSINEATGLPRYFYNATAQDVLDVLNLDADELFPGDILKFDFILHLTTGESFGAINTGVSVKSQPYYQSPFAYVVSINCEPADGFAIGTYDMTVPEGNGCGTVFCSTIIKPDVVSVRVGDHPNQRIFELEHAAGRQIDFAFELDCGDVYVPDQDLGIGCDTSVRVLTETLRRPYNAANDNTIEMLFSHNYTGACGGIWQKQMVIRLERM